MGGSEHTLYIVIYSVSEGGGFTSGSGVKGITVYLFAYIKMLEKIEKCK